MTAILHDRTHDQQAAVCYGARYFINFYIQIQNILSYISPSVLERACKKLEVIKQKRLRKRPRAPYNIHLCAAISHMGQH